MREGVRGGVKVLGWFFLEGCVGFAACFRSGVGCCGIYSAA